jgi:hypothetical protein
MRDKEYYLKILKSPPYVRISITLAAAMVYAALYGECELEHRRTDEFKAIAQQLKSRYGCVLSVEKASEEMRNAINGNPEGKQL